MFFFSKSKYCDFVQCPKIPWLKKYKPEEYVIDAQTMARFVAGNEVGDLAMGLFGEYVETTAYKDDGKLDIAKMKVLTQNYIKEGIQNICEASFDYKGLYCAVDILRKTPNGYDIYEVKSSTSPDNYAYITDTSYQRYVLKKCGIKVNKVYVVTINSSYVFDGKLDLNKFFNIDEITPLLEEDGKIELNLREAEKVMSSKTEPDIDISLACEQPYSCAFFGYCTRGLPSPSVFDLYRLGYKKKLELYQSGIIGYGDVLNSGMCLTSDIRRRQVEYALENKGTYVDKEGINGFLKTLAFPLYFLDFETVQPVIPQYIGTRPYQQIPVQYSLHILQADGQLDHREFLGRSEEDPRRALAERLVADIPDGACVLAYNKTFECGRIEELALAFPDLGARLMNIRGNIKDLLDPFQSGFYYNRGMGGSFSIKSVLPAIYPDDPKLNYHNLEGVHNGSEAMELFPKLKDMPAEVRAEAERNLLKYCELDTYAMVKLYEELKKVSR